MSKAIGIDLGTTNSAAGLKKLATEIIPNAEGELLTPSVVALKKGKGLFSKASFVVGKHARQWMAQDSENTIVSIKRLMGRSFQDPDVQRLIQEKRFAYTIQPLSSGSAHSLAVLLQGQEFTPEEISTKIIEKIKQDSETVLGEPIESVVVTVPAYFNDKQKHVTRMAAARAGLKVQRLLPEPTAAAISFGVDNLSPGEARTVMIFDLGGGTFDLSILSVSDGQFIEQGKGGDMWMGGDDIDALIQKYVYQQTEKEHGLPQGGLQALIDRLSKEKKDRFLSDMKQKVEAGKVQLSSREKTFIEVLGLLQDEEGDLLDIEVELTRQQFETLLLPFAERTMTLMDQVIEETHFDLSLIDQVVMVGGSSSIPLMVQKVRERFGAEKVLVHERPMLAIAEGAAIMAHRLSDSYECPSCGQEVSYSTETCPSCQFDLAADLAKGGVVDIVHTTSHDYFLQLEGEEDYLLVPQHTPLPFTTQATFRLVDGNQQLAHFKFHNRVGTARESIGDLWLSFDKIERGDDQQPAEIVLDFRLDEDNLITVTAALKDHPEIKVGRTLSRGNVDEKLFLDLEKGIARINQEGYLDYYVALEFFGRSVPIARAINQVIDPETGKEDEKAIEQVQTMMALADQLVEEEETPTANLYYAQSTLEHYGMFLAPKDRDRLAEKIVAFETTNQQGTLKKILKDRDGLFKEIDKYPVISEIQQLDNAMGIVAEDDPAQLPKLEKHWAGVLHAMKTQDKETLFRLLDEVRPDVDRVHAAYEKKKLHIRTEIRR